MKQMAAFCRAYNDRTMTKASWLLKLELISEYRKYK